MESSGLITFGDLTKTRIRPHPQHRIQNLDRKNRSCYGVFDLSIFAQKNGVDTSLKAESSLSVEITAF